MAICLIAGCGGSIGNAQQRLRTAVDAQQDKLDGCYTRSLARDAKGKGAMQLLVHVTGSGVIDGVTVTSSAVADPKLENCVRSAFRKIQLQPGPGADFEIEYTLEFGPDG